MEHPHQRKSSRIDSIAGPDYLAQFELMDLLFADMGNQLIHYLNLREPQQEPSSERFQYLPLLLNNRLLSGRTVRPISSIL